MPEETPISPAPPSDPPTESPPAADPPASPPAETPTEALQRPDWFPKGSWDPVKFAGEDGNLDLEAAAQTLAERYSEVKTKVMARKEDLREEVASEYKESLKSREGVPTGPDGYTFEKPHFIDDKTDLGVDTENDPLFTWFRNIAHDRNLTQSEFTELTDQYVELLLDNQPDRVEEMEKLGEFSDRRVERAQRWAKQSLTEESYETLMGVATTSQSIKMIEEIMQAAGQPEFRMTADNVPQESLTKADLHAMMAQEGYINGKDRALIAKVKAGWLQFAKKGDRKMAS